MCFHDCCDIRVLAKYHNNEDILNNCNDKKYNYICLESTYYRYIIEKSELFNFNLSEFFTFNRNEKILTSIEAFKNIGKMIDIQGHDNFSRLRFIEMTHNGRTCQYTIPLNKIIIKISGLDDVIIEYKKKRNCFIASYTNNSEEFIKNLEKN